MKGRDLPLAVRMTDEGGLARLLQGARSLVPFGILNHTCNPDLLLGGINEVLARMIHDDYVKTQEKQGKTKETNPSMTAWEDLPEHLRESNRRQADHIGSKLRAAWMRSGADFKRRIFKV